jgi:hypothetical protein
VRAAIVQIPDQAWVPAQDQAGAERANGQLCEITGQHRFQAILTDQREHEIAVVGRDHRARARVEDHIRNDKDTGLRNFHARTATLRLQASWPWTGELAAAFQRLRALPTPG